MKSRETKERDLADLTESLANSKSAMVMSFNGLTVNKDQEFRNSLRQAGASYQVVKNTLARIAVKGTQFEDVSDQLKGVTAIAWTDSDPVVMSKAITKFMKDNVDLYTFKTGVVDGKLVNLAQLTTISNLPSKEELISKLLFVLNSGAQRLVTVINAVPRNLAVVVKQIGELDDRAAASSASSEKETAVTEPSEPTVEAIATDSTTDTSASGDVSNDQTPEPSAVQAETSTEASDESMANDPDDASEDILEVPGETAPQESSE